MKKRIMLWLTILYCLLFSFMCQSVPVNQTYEAETATLQDSMLVKSDQSASGNQYIYMPEKMGSVLFNVDATATGRYALFIAYQSPQGDNAQHILINDKEYAPEIGFTVSKQWTEVRHAAGLQAGQNTVELKASWGNMSVDYLRVEGPIFEPPEITPVKNVYYKNRTTSDRIIQLNKNHNSLMNVTLEEKPLLLESEPVWYLEDAVKFNLPVDFLETLNAGSHQILFNFENTESISFQLNIKDSEPESDWTIISLDVRHGTSVLMRLPTGKHLLIDTGTEQMCQERVIPFLDRHQIDLDYLWITHHHRDHEGGKDLLLSKYPDLIITDNHDYQTDQQFDFENIQCLILNSYSDGNDQGGENSRSLSIRMEYHGFVYTHGGDIYGENQQKILKRYSKNNSINLLLSHVYHANHHFHGSVDVNYLRAIDPYLMLVSGEEHIYGRGAYTCQVQQNVIQYLHKNEKRLIEDLLPFEVGHVVLRIKDKEIWQYETYQNLEAIIPFL
ncbi:CBM35 domain-containing protein [bacterium]